MKISFIENKFTDKSSVDRNIKSGRLEIYLPKSLRNIKKDIVSALILPEISEKLVEAIPFNELVLSNKVDILKIAKSFISDIEKDLNIFSFKGIKAKKEVDDSIVSIASTVSYLRNNSSVLLFLENFSHSSVAKYRKKMTPGSLGRFKTYEWGNVCIIDLSESDQSKISIQKIDLEILFNEFDAIFWNMGDDENQNNSNLMLTLLGISKSWTMVLNQSKSTYKEIQKAQKHFENFGINLKGIMKSEDSI